MLSNFWNNITHFGWVTTETIFTWCGVLVTVIPVGRSSASTWRVLNQDNPDRFLDTPCVISGIYEGSFFLLFFFYILNFTCVRYYVVLFEQQQPNCQHQCNHGATGCGQKSSFFSPCLDCENFYLKIQIFQIGELARDNVIIFFVFVTNWTSCLFLETVSLGVWASTCKLYELIHDCMRISQMIVVHELKVKYYWKYWKNIFKLLPYPRRQCE